MSFLNKNLFEKLKISSKGNLRELLTFGLHSFELIESGGITVCGESARFKKNLESLKLSANCHGLFSASATQFAIEHNIFLIARYNRENIWYKPNFQTKIHYNVYVNPKIIDVSSETIADWEFCGSFPNIKALVERYKKIKINYLNEELTEKEKELDGFEARVFQHELDHLNGHHIVDINISQGNLVYINNSGVEFKNLEEALKVYNQEIPKLKVEHPEIFSGPRNINTLNTVDEDKNRNYWKRSTRKGTRSEKEQILITNLLSAAQKDWKV